MKILTAFVIAHLFLLVTGTDLEGESKRVGCLYGAFIDVANVLPKDINPTICTHLVYHYGAINVDNEEIEIKPDILSLSPDEDPEGMGPKLRRLKNVNPDLKLILQIVEPSLRWVLSNSSRRANVIQNSVKWLQQNGFDGIDFPLDMPHDTEEVADFYCDWNAELDKHGYSLETTIYDTLLPGPSQQQRDSFQKMASCCDQITLEPRMDEQNNYRYYGLKRTRNRVDKFIESGIPARKLQITVAAAGIAFEIAPLNETEIVVNTTGPENGTFNLKGGRHYLYKELMEKLNNSSLGWTFRREETKEPYAFTDTGLWVTYEDVTSMEYKAHYALEKGLGGISILGMDLEDAEGIGGQGKFPFTRAIYNTFRRGN